MAHYYGLSRHSIVLFLSIFLLTYISPQTPPAPSNFIYYVCYNERGNYTQSSVYESNLKHIFSTSLNTASHLSFFNTTAGDGTDKVYAAFECRQDLTAQVCQDCINNATTSLVQDCPSQKTATIWFQECVFRYSDIPLLATGDDETWVFKRGYDNATNEDQFDKVLGDKLDELIKNAVYVSSTHFATGETNLTAYQKLYCLVQCTPDLGAYDCNKCLRTTLINIQTCCHGRMWTMLFRIGCQVRYDSIPFYSVKSFIPASPPLQVMLPGNINNKRKSKELPMVIVIVVVALAALVVLASCVWVGLQHKKLKRLRITAIDVGNNESLRFDFRIIRAATENFSAANKLGEGGFGTVYKGKLQNGQEIAVKRLTENSGQGDREFRNEVLILAKLQHRNLVKLYGYCLEKDEKLLVYEFVCNASLDQFLFDPNRRAFLDWETRYKIIMGIARGLVYLHEDSRLRIIHRDLKSSNILLDEDMNPKIADFGIARLFEMDQTHSTTTRIIGTYGYMAPEYAGSGQISVKSDAFSFGVVVLEIVSGRKQNYSDQTENNLLHYAWNALSKGAALDLLDTTLQSELSNASKTEVIRCIHVGLLCTQEDAARRPTTAMAMHMLNNNSITLQNPTAPPLLYYTSEVPTQETSMMSRDTEVNATMSDQITDLRPR